MHVLCRPEGGLNDNLVQISRCFEYCKLTSRGLVIDTSSSPGFWQPFSSVFDVVGTKRVKIDCFSDPLVRRRLSAMSVRPAGLKGRLWERGKVVDGKVILEDTGEIVGFNIAERYREELLVVQRYGGGVPSEELLASLTFTREFREILMSRFKNLGWMFDDVQKRFAAVHVRNTDLATDYRAFLSYVAQRIPAGQPCFICSDDPSVIIYAERTYPSIDWFSWSKGRENTIDSNVGLHYSGRQCDSDEAKNLTVNAFMDLLTLSWADDLFVSESRENHKISGFSKLAMLLFSREHILDQWLDLKRGSVHNHGRRRKKIFRKSQISFFLSRICRRLGI